MTKRKDSVKSTTASNSNYTTKAMSDFTVMSNQELRNMEQIMKLVKTRVKERGLNASR